MRLAFQIINQFERTIILDKFLKHHQQLRYRHRPTKLNIDQVNKEKCLKPNPPQKKSFWRIFGKPKTKCVEQETKADCEKIPKLAPEDKVECDLANISRMGGKAYRTCGTAYILQKDTVDELEVKTEPEKQILDNMMKDPSLKGQCDPMPPFESVEKRLIDMNERKLHPLYRILMTIPKKPQSKPFIPPSAAYKMRSGPIMPDEIPEHLKINRELFEKKNIFCEFKRALPPLQMLSRLAEMKKNEKPTMQKKIDAKKKAKQENSK